MNDEKRKNARLQGRFSDEPKPPRKDKSKRKSDEATSKRKSLEAKTVQPADGFELQYDAQANDAQFEEKKPPTEINTPGQHKLSETENGISRVIFEPDFLPPDEAGHLMALLRDSTKWHDKNIIIHGLEVPQPRLVAWYGPFPYAYSGAILDAAEMPPAILEIKERVERYLEAHELKVVLNSVLLNYYRDGKDSVAWHSDDELTMGVNPTIASVSLGETRKFQMKIKHYVRDSVKNLVSEEYFVNLTPGSLLIMDGSMQKDWKHQVPKEYHDKGPRINLTFRTVTPIDKIPPPQVPATKSVDNSNHPSSTKSPHIFDNTNFPTLESANTQNGNGSKVPKNSSALSKSKTGSNTDAYQSDQSDSNNSNMLVDPSHDASGNQDESTSDVDNDYQTDAAKDPIDQHVSALPEKSQLDHPISDVDKAGKKYELNANADEFIPKCPLNEPLNLLALDYDKEDIVKLSDMFRGKKIPPTRYDEFFYVLIEKLEQNPEFLFERDYYEVETYYALYENGLSDDNQCVILDRVCSMIRNAIRMKNRGSYRAPPRSAYRNSYSRSFRGAYKGSTNRERN